MTRHILNKYQIKRLIDGKEVIDSRGRKFIAGENIKELLRKINEYDLYDQYEVIIENNGMDIRKKE